MLGARAGAAPAGPPAVGAREGTFVCVPSPDVPGEFDEYYLAACGAETAVALTTSHVAPHDFMWVELPLLLGAVRTMQGAGADRRPPRFPAVAANQINWISVGARAWSPTAAEALYIQQEGRAMRDQLAGGARGCLPLVQVPRPAHLAGQPAAAAAPPGGVGVVPPMPVAAVGDAALAAAPGLLGAALLPPGAALNQPALGGVAVGAGVLGFDHGDAQTMAEQVLALQESIKDMKVKRSKGDDKKKKKKKKDRKRSRSSGSSSSSSSSSGSGHVNERYVQWTGKDKDLVMTPRLLARMEALRFRRRSDLMHFSTKYPGALGAAFLIQLKAQLHGCAPKKLGDLHKVDPAVLEFDPVPAQGDAGHPGGPEPLGHAAGPQRGEHPACGGPHRTAGAGNQSCQGGERQLGACRAPVLAPVRAGVVDCPAGWGHGSVSTLVEGGRRLREALASGAPFGELLGGVWVWRSACRGPVRDVLRASGRPLESRAPGFSPAHVFPLPCWRPRRLALDGGPGRQLDPLVLTQLVWLWVAFLNAARAEPGLGHVCLEVPTAAQQRCLETLFHRATVFLAELPAVAIGGEKQLNAFLKQRDSGYEPAAMVLPLGVRAGMPERAARVDTAAVLDDGSPPLARAARDPAAVLRSPLLWAEPPPPRFELLASSYPQLVAKGREARLFQLLDPEELPVVESLPVVSGAFAVVKDSKEDRMISPLERCNALVDPTKLEGVEYPHLPQLALLTTQRCVDDVKVKIYVSKRDARHYYQSLAASPAWRRWFAMPPVAGVLGLQHPCHTSWPMGFRGSCAIAQGVTDVVCRRAALPPSLRLLPSNPAPLKLPIWGALLDGVWCLRSSLDPPEDEEASSWMRRLDSEWRSVGVEVHTGKSVDDGVNAEIQGGRVHSSQHLLGLAAEKSSWLMAASWRVLGQWRPARRALERIVGKTGYAHTFRPVARASYGQCYLWLHGLREAHLGRTQWLRSTWWEVMEASLLVPLCQLDFAAGWATHVVATDACPGGHGLSYAVVPVEEQKRWGAYVSFRGDYTTLATDGDLYPGPEVCCLKRATLPLKNYHWFGVHRPGGHKMICLEEFAAANWGLERRLVSLRGTDCRCLQLGDNTVTVSASVKGRSSCRAVHAHCRRRMAIALAGNLFPLEVYLRSKENPADAPSRRLVPRSIDLPTLTVLHLFSGPRRPGDLEAALKQFGAEQEVAVQVMSLDVVLSSQHDLLGDALFSQLRCWCYSGRFFALVAGWPCCTVSAARHRPGGPPPLRSRHWLFGLPSLRGRHREQCRRGTELFLRTLDLASGVLGSNGRVVLENPVDRGRAPYPSFWISPPWLEFERLHRVQKYEGDQCMYGPPFRSAPYWQGTWKVWRPSTVFGVSIWRATRRSSASQQMGSLAQLSSRSTPQPSAVSSVSSLSQPLRLVATRWSRPLPRRRGSAQMATTSEAAD